MGAETMTNVKAMVSMRARKAFVAAFMTMISAGTIASTGSFTLTEVLAISGTGIVTFQATYWTKNKTAYDGAIHVEPQGDKKIFSLELHSDPEELESKSQVIFKVNNSSQ